MNCMCWGAKNSVLLYDYVYFYDYIDILCVGIIVGKENVE